VGIGAIPLRTQSDQRLVRLVREGYESAFEEIVRRYRRPLDRFAASIVGGRSEDVTQDAFRKALVALRREEGEIELRPWLYRIVRNTALNDLRDRPPVAAELADDLMAGAGGRSAAAEAEQRAEVATLTTRMRALPENQRAALVMRELEGMSHEEIAAALGISGGAARQAIARGRAAVRTGFGVVVPLPLLRALASGGDPAIEATVGAGGASAAGSAGAALLGGGGAGVLKVGLATVVVAGSIGAGVAIDRGGGGHHRSASPQAVAPAPPSGGPKGQRPKPTPSPVISQVDPSDEEVSVDDHSGGGGRGDDHRHRHGGRHDIERHRAHGGDDEIEAAIAEPVADDHHVSSAQSGGGPGPSVTSGNGPGPSNPSDGRVSSGRGSGSGHDGQGSGSGGDGSGSHSSGSSDGGHGSDDLTEAVVEAPPAAELSSSGSSSGGPGSSSSSSSGDDGSGSDSGSSGGPEISP
jgi:RNA polymerase sigma factor (sigma-70 family)